MDRSNNLPDNIDDLIIAYLDKSLDNDDIAKVEKKMLEDENFRNQVIAYKTAISGIVMHERNEISKIINRISDHIPANSDTNNQSDTNKKLKTSKVTKMENKSNRRSYLRIAASFLLILAAGSFFFLNKDKTPDHAQLFADNYQKKFPSLDKHIKSIAAKYLGSRGVDPKDTTTILVLGERINIAEAAERQKKRSAMLTDGLRLFKKSDWTNAIITFNKYTEAYKDNSSDYNIALFYSAKSKLNDGHYIKAINDYEKYLHQNGTIDKEMKYTAEWDRAIAYLMVDQSKVKKYLSEIAQNDGHIFQSEAKGLMEYLD